MSKKKNALELNWVNKDKSLYYEYDKDGNPGKPIWVDKNDIRVAEPRILKLKKEYGDCSKLKDPLDNALIKGDNLLALRTLVELFKDRPEKDKVKCVYIDPPYNTGSAFEHYDDNLEHSAWLTMMRDRLKLIRELMCEDGLIFVQIDSRELGYLINILDEIFGRNNFLSLITCRVKGPSGVATGKTIFDVSEYIAVYKWGDKFSGLERFKFPVEVIDEKSKTSKQYGYVLETFGDSKEIIAKYKTSNGQIIEIHKNYNYKFKTIPQKERTKGFYVNNFKKIFRLETMSGGVEKQLVKLIPDNDLYSYKYIPTKGKNAGKETQFYIFKKGGPHFLKEGAELTEIEDEEGDKEEVVAKMHTITNIITDNWWQGISKEGGVEFKNSKKPEKLMKLVTEMVTKKEDLILDSFLGCGTTAAVAHKLNRRWIGIEIGKHAEEKCVKRMKNVIGGDPTGISKEKEVNWQGGGGFRYYELGDALIKDNDINWELNEKGKLIAEAVFLNTDFKYIEELGKGIFFGKRRKKYALCIINKKLKVLSKKEIEEIIDKIPNDYDILEIFTNMGMAIKPEDLAENIQIKKIPYAIQEKFSRIDENKEKKK